MTDIASFIELLHQRLAERRRHRGEVVLSEAEVQTAVDLLSWKQAEDPRSDRVRAAEYTILDCHNEIERLHALLDKADEENERLRGDIVEHDARALAIEPDRLQAELRELDLKPKKPKAIKQQP